MSVIRESVIAAAVRRCGREGGVETAAEGAVRAWKVYEFQEDFAGFAGHFPDSPLVPGVCLIAAAMQTLEEILTRPWELVAVGQAKYFLPVRPGTRLRCEAGTVAEDEECFTIRAVFVALNGEEGNTAAKLRLTGRFL